MQEPTLDHLRTYFTWAADELALAGSPISSDTIFQPASSINLLLLGDLTEAAGEHFPGTVAPGSRDFLRPTYESALQRRQSEIFSRNPYLSLQQGPFVPCSADDPKGRCLTPRVRALQNRAVRRTATGGF